MDLLSKMAARIKPFAVSLFDWLFLEIAPYILIGRRRLHLFLLKLYSRSVGKNFNFHYGVLFAGTKYTTFGNNIDIGRNSFLSFGNTRSYIGDNVMMGEGVKLITIVHGYSDSTIPMKCQKAVYSPIIIEDDVWLGDGVKVISGSRPVKISKGVIVGAGAVVIGNLDTENGIYAGLPARFVKMRF